MLYQEVLTLAVFTGNSPLKWTLRRLGCPIFVEFLLPPGVESQRSTTSNWHHTCTNLHPFNAAGEKLFYVNPLSLLNTRLSTQANISHSCHSNMQIHKHRVSLCTYQFSESNSFIGWAQLTLLCVLWGRTPKRPLHVFLLSGVMHCLQVISFPEVWAVVAGLLWHITWLFCTLGSGCCVEPPPLSQSIQEGLPSTHWEPDPPGLWAGR